MLTLRRRALGITLDRISMAATGKQPKRRGRPPSGGREAILDATLALMRERGIANLTSRDVAARAGVSDASVYYHFKDRTGLIEAAFAHGMESLRSIAEADLSKAPPNEVLPAAFDSLVCFYRILVPILYAAQADEELRMMLSDYMHRRDLGPHKGVATLGCYLRKEQASGHVRREANADAIALLVIDCAFAFASRAEMLTDEKRRLPSREAVLAEIMRLL